MRASAKSVSQIGVIGLAATVALFPPAAPVAERFYARWIYPVIQANLTALSNCTSLALFDLTLSLTILGLIGGWIFWLRRARRERSIKPIGRGLFATLAGAAIVYLWFVAAWGFNYARPPLETMVPYDASRVTPSAVRLLAEHAVREANRTHAAAHAAGFPALHDSPRPLVDALHQVERELGRPQPTRVAQPKTSWLSPFFRASGVSGMLAPFYLETLLNPDLTGPERPIVLAHEWAHLSGYAPESDASFVGYLAALRAGPAAEYSAWLELVSESANQLQPITQRLVLQKLDAGPQGDQEAIRQRLKALVQPVERAAWSTYDQMLKSQGVEEGVQSYSRVIQLLIGTDALKLDQTMPGNPKGLPPPAGPGYGGQASLKPMNTRVLTVDSTQPDPAVIAEAAEALRAGKLVAFPTETVYGLGANAMDPAAVARIFEAKGRPATDPLIVHLAHIGQLSLCASHVPPAARKLGLAFWAGPLTIILPKKLTVPDSVTAGLPSVALRVPSHRVARALLEMAGVPVAAPSANRFSRPSPTTAAHVLADLAGRIDVVIDGGPTDIGLESTIVDFTVDPPVMRRPGGLMLEQIRTVVPEVVAVAQQGSEHVAQVAPGQLTRHYAPQAELTLYEGAVDRVVHRLAADTRTLTAQGARVGILAPEDDLLALAPDLAGLASAGRVEVRPYGSRSDPARAARELFAALRALDATGVTHILATSIGTDGLGLAVQDRLSRAAEGRVRRV